MSRLAIGESASDEINPITVSEQETPVSVQVLSIGDEERLDRFLRSHGDLSMFLRSNLRDAGIVDQGKPFQGTYAARLEGDEVVAVAAHTWRDTFLLLRPGHEDDRALLDVALAASGRPVKGFVGPATDVTRARAQLRLVDAEANLEETEVLYRLDLVDLCVPDALTTGAVRGRRATLDDLPLLTAHRIAFSIEALGMPEAEARKVRFGEGLGRSIERGRWFVLEADGEVVSVSAFNAETEDRVQIGGVFTPTELRSRGYGRAVVAASLLDARERGVTGSVLFTPHSNRAAQRSYEALGYESAGDYRVVELTRPHEVRSGSGRT